MDIIFDLFRGNYNRRYFFSSNFCEKLYSSDGFRPIIDSQSVMSNKKL